MTLDIILLILGISMVGLGVFIHSKSSARRIELDVELIPGTTDNVIGHFKKFRNVDVAGILGTDFLDKYDYVIDFNKGIVKHKSYAISFKEAMELLGIPYIVLWQNGTKYIFIVDTGSSKSHISSKKLDTLDFEYDTSETFTTVGAGGNVESQGIVKTKFYYR